MKDEEEATCPSSQCKEGSLLLGIVQADGRMGFLGVPLEVDTSFVERAHAGRSPERRFRFASPCLECGCQQWTGSRCRVIDDVIDEVADTGSSDLPRCGIRGSCRWFRQQGVDACRVCPIVITDTLSPQGAG